MPFRPPGKSARGDFLPSFSLLRWGICFRPEFGFGRDRRAAPHVGGPPSGMSFFGSPEPRPVRRAPRAEGPQDPRLRSRRHQKGSVTRPPGQERRGYRRARNSGPFFLLRYTAFVHLRPIGAARPRKRRRRRICVQYREGNDVDRGAGGPGRRAAGPGRAGPGRDRAGPEEVRQPAPAVWSFRMSV